MTNYGVAVYGTSAYGQSNQIPLTVSPITLTVLYPTVVVVNWNAPTGTYSAIRLVRNQNSIPETAEDGVIIWQSTTSAVTKVSFNDGGGIEDTAGIPIVPGKPIYYAIFLFTSDNVWTSAGAVSDIVPSSHGSTDALFRNLPRVFTTAEQSPLGEPDYTSDLYSFLDGMGFTLDESLTLLDLLLPDHTRINTPISLLSIETANYGLTPEPGMAIKNQKQLIREAIYLYTHKGTLPGLNTYAASLTGYSPTITTSSNLLLNVQDSTFYKSTGNWNPTNATISSSQDEAPVAQLTTNYIDLNYSCKIVATAAGSMTLGKDSPILKGVPITPGTQYTLSAQTISPTSAGTVTPSLQFYDRFGKLIGSSISGTGVAANNTWKQITQTATAYNQYTAYITSAVGVAGSTNVTTYTTSAPHSLTSGEVVTISGFTTTGFNHVGATITGVTTTTFTISSTFAGTSVSTESGIAQATSNNSDACYAGITFSWSAAGTYYIDCVSLQAGSTASYNEARAIDVFLNPSKTNYIKNPSFEVNVTDGWTLTGTAVATQISDVPIGVYSGTKSVQIVATGAWTYISNAVPITAGTYHTASAYVKSSTDMTLHFIGKNSGGTTIDDDIFDLGIIPAWTLVYGTDLTDATDLSTVTYQVQFTGGAGTFHIDAVQFENTFRFNPTTTPHFTPTDYIDGSLPAAFGATWGGTSNNSYSYTYINKPLKVLTLANTITDWIPSNSFWRIRTYAGVEYTNLTV